jgi:glycosyltransferase involved in cell wall biosynthesis
MGQYCDWIVVYDDASSDNSYEIAKEYTPHVIKGDERIWFPTLPQKQKILDYIANHPEINPDWIVWLDTDEVLDANGTKSIREWLGKVPPNIKGLEVHELNLWKCNSFKRVDSLFDDGWFLRLWRYSKGLRMRDTTELHPIPYPANLNPPYGRAAFEVIHFGFDSHERIVAKTKDYLERGMTLEQHERFFAEKTGEFKKVPLDKYPEHCRPKALDDFPELFSVEQWHQEVKK